MRTDIPKKYFYVNDYSEIKGPGTSIIVFGLYYGEVEDAREDIKLVLSQFGKQDYALADLFGDIIEYAQKGRDAYKKFLKEYIEIKKFIKKSFKNPVYRTDYVNNNLLEASLKIMVNVEVSQAKAILEPLLHKGFANHW